jgi:hypothetical protein
MFILLCELFVASTYDEMNCEFFLKFFIIYFEGQILIRLNNHESGVSMNGSVKNVEN